MNTYRKLQNELKRLRALFPNTVIITATQPSRRHTMHMSRNRYGLGQDFIVLDHLSLLKEPKTIEDDGN